MDHRMLATYERTDEQCMLCYSYRGAVNLKPKRRISIESPFGGDDTGSKWAKRLLTKSAGGLEADAVDGYLAGEGRLSSVVEPEPRAIGLTLDGIVTDRLNYLYHEAFFVVSTTLEVTVYRTLWFRLQYGSKMVRQGETARNGALATVRWYGGEPVGDDHLQGQLVTLKNVVGDMLDKGVFAPSTARQYLRRKLAERVGDRQELLIPTGESPSEKANPNYS